MEVSKKVSRRISKLPPYLFAALEAKTEEMRKQGKDTISFGIGDPDLPTPEHVVNACIEAAKKPENYRYPSWSGKQEFREAAAAWFKKMHGVELSAEKEVLTLIGSKEGIYHMPFAFVDKGDFVLCPEPAYPVYSISTGFAGGIPYVMPLKEENNFLPDFDEIPKKAAKKAKLLWLNYPNNPTAAIAEKEFYEKAVDFAKENNIILCSDEAYSAIAYDDYKPLSLLEIDGAKERSIVFCSLSKTYNMTGWRVGFACGNAEIVGALGKIKSNADSGVANIMQDAATAALKGSDACIGKNIGIYKERRDVLVKGLEKLGFKVNKPRATFYLWLKINEKREKGSSMEFAEKLLKEGVVVTPGIGFGKYGEGYARFALTQPKERIKEAIERMGKALGA